MTTKYDIGDKVWVIASEYCNYNYLPGRIYVPETYRSTIENGIYLYDFSEDLTIGKINWLHNAKIIKTNIRKINIDKDGVAYYINTPNCFENLSENGIYISKELAEKALLNYRCGKGCCCCCCKCK